MLKLYISMMLLAKNSFLTWQPLKESFSLMVGKYCLYIEGCV